MAGLEILADIAAIVTAVIAATAYGRYRWERRVARAHLERSLNPGAITYLDELIAKLRMTEAEIFEAARSNRRIDMGIDPGGWPIPTKLWFRITR